MRLILIILLTASSVFAQVKVQTAIHNGKISAEHFIDENTIIYLPLWNDAKDRANRHTVTTQNIGYTTGYNDKTCAVFESAEIFIPEISSKMLPDGYSLSMLINPKNLGENNKYKYLFSSGNRSISANFDSSTTGLIRCGVSVSTPYGYAVNRKYLKPNIYANNWHKYGESYHNNIFRVHIDGNTVYQLDCRPYKKSLEFETTTIAVQGVCSDGEYIYTTDAGYLDKFDQNGNKLLSVKMYSRFGHMGDFCVVGEYLYIPYVYPHWGGSECGVARMNKSDLSVDPSFADNGKKILSDDLPDNDASALCWNGSNFYLLGYTDKVYRYNADFTRLLSTYTVDTDIVSEHGKDEGGDYAHVGDGITYDRKKERFFITFHGYLAFSIDKNFDNRSIIYTIPQTADGKINCQGVDWLNTNRNGQETILIANRDIGSKHNGVMKITRQPNSIKYKIRQWSGFAIGYDNDGTYFDGKIQEAILSRFNFKR